eukprot:CAMPEP_0198199360 /NCGR_PEP_ID=MMETSP1445-20131203/2670_1 /TAXON_ID=36898 /ORGANISM="Pyramimonas sp., Strain CCMP2087" /LENGTH=316 /DNA_ID=CAMNT_0043869187 /DNA_START=121 /DNA_END=1068 /DNA_ORIENTATION=+
MGCGSSKQADAKTAAAAPTPAPEKAPEKAVPAKAAPEKAVPVKVVVEKVPEKVVPAKAVPDKAPAPAAAAAGARSSIDIANFNKDDEEKLVKVQAAVRGKIARDEIRAVANNRRKSEDIAGSQRQQLNEEELAALKTLEEGAHEAISGKDAGLLHRGRLAKQKAQTERARKIKDAEVHSSSSLDMQKIKSMQLADFKAQAANDWEPDYVPETIVPPSESTDTISRKSTRVSLPLILVGQKAYRKTKIVCTLGPKCWSEEGLGQLLDAGMNIARFNFSHGDHADHQAVLDRLKGVIKVKNKHTALLLDTKGPEIRTA